MIYMRDTRCRPFSRIIFYGLDLIGAPKVGTRAQAIGKSGYKGAGNWEKWVQGSTQLCAVQKWVQGSTQLCAVQKWVQGSTQLCVISQRPRGDAGGRRSVLAQMLAAAYTGPLALDGSCWQGPRGANCVFGRGLESLQNVCYNGTWRQAGKRLQDSTEALSPGL
jgi:hypothetical protein